MADWSKFLTVYNFEKKLRYGSRGDGGYVIGALPGTYDCYISAGVGDEESFSRDFIKFNNMSSENSYAFDGSVADFPRQFTSDITFMKKYIICPEDLAFLTDKYDDIFVKMDIEGHEFNVFNSFDDSTMNKLKQIVVEVHGLMDDSWWTKWGLEKTCSTENKIAFLEKMTKTHYLIHAHANNGEPVNNGIPVVIELTYVHKKFFSEPPGLNKTRLPIPYIDFPNHSWVPEHQLNHPPFVN
jgi:hypothetical protein